MTTVNAEILQDSALGRIGVGAHADVVILDGNPFDDGSVLWDPARPRTVVQGGRVTA